MIKLTDCDRRLTEPHVVYISKDNIGTMAPRETDGIMYTEISTKEDRPAIYVKETPEEILAMPDIETTKTIDWEQRRFDLVSALFVKYACSPDNLHYLLNDIIPQADALIDELKKGGEK